MGQAIGELLPFAFAVALSPMPIVAVVLMLITPRARSNGLAFLAGWIIGIAIVGTIILSVVGPSDPTDQGVPATWVNVLKLVLGVLLGLVAVRQWRARPGDDGAPAMPKWMGALDGFTPAKSGGLAVLLGSINPKNLLLIVAGGTAVAQTGIEGGQQAVAWAVFTVIASIGVGAPVVLFLLLGARATPKLEALKTWMVRNNATVMAVLCAIIGVKLIGDAISGFSA